MLTLSLETARRYILGAQGLWPGRRWRGLPGTERAMRAMAYLQLDPLQVVARSQDIALHSRVIDYTPGLWETPTYAKRKFFDWGGWLAVRPMDELPYWRVVMAHERDGSAHIDGRIHELGREHAAAVADVLALLRERGQVSNRDFEMATRTRTQSYRGRKDSALALYCLWRTGAVMTHHRENFERVYALAEAIAPPQLQRTSSEAEAERFLVQKEVQFFGLWRPARIADAWHRGSLFPAVPRVIEALLADGDLIEVQVEGWKQRHYALGAGAQLLADLSAGRTPKAWKPLATTTLEEAVFLAPLDPVSARGRAKLLFDFDYVWEVYKPAPKRKYGYYTLPVLWGDRLVARFDSKLDRERNRLVVLGFWLEDKVLAKNNAFAAALARGFGRFQSFLGARALDAKALPKSLRPGEVNPQITQIQ
jgi:hypothetical protein